MDDLSLSSSIPPSADAWSSLRAFTAARIALGRTGTAIPLQEIMNLKLAHAHARDAVYSELQMDELAEALAVFDLGVCRLQSKATDRRQYLQRPDLGKRLDEPSVQQLQDVVPLRSDICIILADGLSALAINAHAVPLLHILIPLLKSAGLVLGPFTIVQQGRVAVGDEIGFMLRTKLSLILIGERPGLSSPDSMGAYLTYEPAIGLTDERRNCISNIRPEGLSFGTAATKIFSLVKESLRLKLSGVSLKDNTSFHPPSVTDDTPHSIQ